MSIRSIAATERLDNISDSDHVLFLAGPIQGARDWHSEAISVAEEKFADTNLIVASPNSFAGKGSKSFSYENQVTWEIEHLKRAAQLGCILFYFAEQEYEVVKPDTEFARPYGQTTAKEVMMWWTLKMNNPILDLVLAFEPKSVGAKYLRHLNGETLPEIPIVETGLRDAVELSGQIALVSNFSQISLNND